MNFLILKFTKQTTIRLNSIYSVIFKTVQYISRGKVIQTEKRELSVIKGAKIRPGSRDEFHNKKLYVPPLPPTNVRNCHLIHLNYDVFVSRTHNCIVKKNSYRHLIYK